MSTSIASPTAAFDAAEARVLERHDLRAHHRFVTSPTLGGGGAHVLEVGSGPSLVLVNGIGLPGAMWAPLIPHLPEHTVHAVDLPGFGRTDPLPRRADHLRADTVAFLADVLDDLGIGTATIVANSYGSRVATWLAADRPDRVGALVHVGCPALAPGTSAPLPMRVMSTALGRLLLAVQPPSPRQVEQLSSMVHEDPLAPEIADLILATEQLPHFEPMFRATLRRLVRLRGARPESAMTEGELAGIAVPSLLVIGRDDPFGSEEAGRRMASSLPSAPLHVVDGGHAPWLDSPRQIGELVTEFLRRIGR